MLAYRSPAVTSSGFTVYRHLRDESSLRPSRALRACFLQVRCILVRSHKVCYAGLAWEVLSAAGARMKLVLPGILVILVLAQLGVGQQPCSCAGPSCSCASSPPVSEGSDGPALSAPAAPPEGSREFLTPAGDYQSPSSAGTQIRPGNVQQSPTWVGATMISSSDDAVVLVRLEPLNKGALSLSRLYRMLCCTCDPLQCRPARKA